MIGSVAFRVGESAIHRPRSRNTRFKAPIIGDINWAFAWICPVFFLFIFGLFWKRSAKVAGFTLGISWVVNALWSLTPLPTLFGTTADIVPNGYITSVLGFIIPLIGNCIVKDAKMGYWKEKGLKNKEVK